MSSDFRPMVTFRLDTRLPPEMLNELGRLAVVTAEAEELLHRIYWRHAGLNEKNGPIVTDNINPKRLMEDVIKFLKLKPAEENVLLDLEDIFAEFEGINTKRNHCLHWIWEVIESKPERVEIGMGTFGYSPPKTYQVNRPAYRQSGVKTEPFTTADIQKLCDDASWIVQRFRSHAISEEQLRENRKELQHLEISAPHDSSVRTMADLFWPAPWLDKPSPPKSKP